MSKTTIDSVYEKLGSVEGKLDIMVPLAQSNDKRLNKVEKKLSRHSGIIATVATLFTAMVAFLSDW